MSEDKLTWNKAAEPIMSILRRQREERNDEWNNVAAPMMKVLRNQRQTDPYTPNKDSGVDLFYIKNVFDTNNLYSERIKFLETIISNLKDELKYYNDLKNIVNEITTGLGGLKDGENLVDKIWDMRDELEDLRKFRNGRDEN
jgi:hypothetical protein